MRNGLADHLRCLAHRVLFVRKGSDATDPFLWSGLGASRMTAEGQHVKHTAALTCRPSPWQQPTDDVTLGLKTSEAEVAFLVRIHVAIVNSLFLYTI